LAIVVTWFLAKVLPLPARTHFTQGFYYALSALLISVWVASLRTYDVLTRRTRWGGAHLKDRLGLSEVRMQLILIEVTLVAYIIVAALVFGAAEDWDFDSAVYFCIVTFTTIGFGDIAPKTIIGQIFVPFLGSVGIIIFAMTIWATREVFLESIAMNLAGQFSVLFGAKPEDVGGDHAETLRAPHDEPLQPGAFGRRTYGSFSRGKGMGHTAGLRISPPDR
ncbi:Potassium channel, partial [Gonapodya sp. JEL0774]